MEASVLNEANWFCAVVERHGLQVGGPRRWWLIQSALREWTYGHAYRDPEKRCAAFAYWGHDYNRHQPHHGIGNRVSMSSVSTPQTSVLVLYQRAVRKSQAVVASLPPSAGEFCGAHDAGPHTRQACRQR